MKLAILHDALGEGAAKDEQDSLVQVSGVSQALSELGYEGILLPFLWNLDLFKRHLLSIKPDLIFNLVESLQGEGHLIHFAPTLLDVMKIPYTGCSSESIYLTSNKLIAKRMMRLEGICTPDWITAKSPYQDIRRVERKTVTHRYIIKSVWEHASIGIDDTSVVGAEDPREICLILKRRNSESGSTFFAEQYIEGREFNLSLISNRKKVRVLPPAEMKFSKNNGSRPRVLFYAAKWNEGSPEYTATKRSFDFSEHDIPILHTIETLALRCWSLFGLNGYARVDFRVDSSGTPYVLEVNANPCISPDSGFVAAVKRAGMNYNGMVRSIIGHPVEH